MAVMFDKKLIETLVRDLEDAQRGYAANDRRVQQAPLTAVKRIKESLVQEVKINDSPEEYATFNQHAQNNEEVLQILALMNDDIEQSMAMREAAQIAFQQIKKKMIAHIENITIQ